MTYSITTIDPKRAAVWENLFNLDTLPVLSATPRWQCLGGHHETLAYDLDLARLSWIQRSRFAAHVAWRTRRPFDQVLVELNTACSYPIKATGCIAVADSETAQTRPSLFVPVAGYGRLALAN